MPASIAWLRQPSTVHGIAILIATAFALAIKAITFDSAKVGVAYGLALIMIPDRGVAEQVAPPPPPTVGG